MKLFPVNANLVPTPATYTHYTPRGHIHVITTFVEEMKFIGNVHGKEELDYAAHCK